MSRWQALGMSRMDDLLDACAERLTTTDVAELLGVSEQTVLRWLRKGELPGYKLPRGWIVLREDLREYLRQAYNMKDAEKSAPERD